MKLGELPAGVDLIASLTEAGRSLSLLYANTPDARAEASLHRYTATIRPDLAETVGERMANLMIDAFAKTVMAQKHRIERAGASRA